MCLEEGAGAGRGGGDGLKQGCYVHERLAFCVGEALDSVVVSCLLFCSAEISAVLCWGCMGGFWEWMCWLAGWGVRGGRGGDVVVLAQRFYMTHGNHRWLVVCILYILIGRKISWNALHRYALQPSTGKAEKPGTGV